MLFSLVCLARVIFFFSLKIITLPLPFLLLNFLPKYYRVYLHLYSQNCFKKFFTPCFLPKWCSFHYFVYVRLSSQNYTVSIILSPSVFPSKIMFLKLLYLLPYFLFTLFILIFFQNNAVRIISSIPVFLHKIMFPLFCLPPYFLLK